MNKLITDYAKETDNIVVICKCADHLLQISRWKDNLNEFYVEVVPSCWPVWGRIKAAWKMLWYGPQVEEVIINTNQMKELVEILNDLVNEKNKIK